MAVTVYLSDGRGRGDQESPREMGMVRAKMLREVSAAIGAVQGGVERVGVFRAI